MPIVSFARSNATRQLAADVGEIHLVPPFLAVVFRGETARSTANDSTTHPTRMCGARSWWWTSAQKCTGIMIAMAIVFVAVPRPAFCQPDKRDYRHVTPQSTTPLQVDRHLVETEGITVLSGRHVTVFTDVHGRSDVDELPQVFDLAVPQYCKYFNIDPELARTWHVDTCIISDRARFQRAGLFPSDMPQFLAGFQRGGQTWIYDQPPPYYVRHLLLHEGTHAFMLHFLGATGPPWYSEGMAELVALNRWRDGKLTLAYNVQSRDDVPDWGRVRLLRDAVDAGQSRSLRDVLSIESTAFRQVDSYAWAWAACEFLSKHPLSAEVFRQLPDRVSESPERFNQALTDSLNSVWDQLEFEWSLFLDEIDYGFDVRAMALRKVGNPSDAANQTQTLDVSSQFGWQLTSISLRSGQRVSLTSDGEFQIANDGVPWPSRANGVTIEYHQGKPIGRMIAAVFPNDFAATRSSTLEVFDVGEHNVIQASSDGVLALRINDSPAKLGDNVGGVQVTIGPVR